MTVRLPVPRGASSSEVLESAARLFRATLLKCLPFAMIAVLFGLAPEFYTTLTTVPARNLASDPVYAALSLVALIAYLYLFSVVLLRQQRMSVGVVESSPVLLREAARRLPALLGAWLLAGLSVALGLVLLVVPGVFLFVCYSVLMPVVMLEGRSPYAALKRSVELMRPLWWRAFGVLVVALIVVVVSSIMILSVIYLIAHVLMGQGPAYQAIADAAVLAVQAVIAVFFSAVYLTLHAVAKAQASASSSA